MKSLIAQCLQARETRTRLQTLGHGAPASALVSLRFPLPAGANHWLEFLPPHNHYWYRARPSRQEYRLGIGHALQLASQGPQRFAALDNALTGLGKNWRYEDEPPLAFAGFAFSPHSLEGHPNALLAVPALLLESLAGRCTLTLTTSLGQIDSAIDAWPKHLEYNPIPAPADASTAHATLAERAWIARVDAALREIARGQIDKLVLSRCQKLLANADFSPAGILDHLNTQQANSTIYAYGDGQQSFLGATPERLVRLHAGELTADALAGTAWPGSQALDSDKNRREQALVVDAVHRALAPYCVSPPRIESGSEHAQGPLRHLRNRISGQALAGTTLFDLVGALHPTPAVGGFPSLPAQAWLHRHGDQRHGWYAGGFGLLTANGDGEFSVALRSALLNGKEAHLQAGAGIVAGSDPRQEFAETDAKLQTLLSALLPQSRPNSRCA